MKSRAVSVLVSIVMLAVGYFVVKGITYTYQEKQATGITTTEYKRIAVKACVKEATNGTGISEVDANTYCVCTINRVYGNKSLKEMQAIDADVIKNGFSEKYDQVVLDCAELIQDNYL